MSLEEQLSQMQTQLEQARKQLEKSESQFSELLQTNFYQSIWKNVDPDLIKIFVRKPYMIKQLKEDEWQVIIPNFIPLEVGWLEYQTESYKVFRVNKYVDWILPIPEVLKDELGIDKPELGVKFDWDSNIARIEAGTDIAKVKKKYGKFINKQLDSTSLQVKNQQKFSFMVEMLKDGILPFQIKKVDEEDVVLKESKIELREYQQEAWLKFLDYSHVGIFYPYGAGKSIFGLYVVHRIKGEKLIVVPSLTLADQWRKRIGDLHDPVASQTEIITYQSAMNDRVRRKDYSLVVFDECHHLPANVFSAFAFIKRKYTIGLSGSPYREDGRTELIFALTGYPIGRSWNYFFEKGIVKKPRVSVRIVKGFNEKLFELDELLKTKSITLIQCDSIQKGQMLANKFRLNFIHGGTKNRLQLLEQSLERDGSVILSRVGDEGISLPKLQRTIEFDFLFGSRRQEGQRAGRGFHAEEEAEHIILMTQDEYSNHKKRLYSLLEKGINVEIQNKVTGN